MKHIFLIFLTTFSFGAFAQNNDKALFQKQGYIMCGANQSIKAYAYKDQNGTWHGKKNNEGLSLIKRRGLLRCGTNLDVNTFAYKDKDGSWQGIDADVCKILATAILGKKDAFEMVDVKNSTVSNYLTTAKIDLAIGNFNNSASNESQTKAVAATTIYYDNLKFLAYKKEGATSMNDYKGANICITNKDALNMFNIQRYNYKYNLNLNILNFASRKSAKEGFLLKRCHILADQETYLKGISHQDAFIIDEDIDALPIKILVNKENQTLETAIKWITNAIIAAEELNITSKNIQVFTPSNDPYIQNLLGDNPKPWQTLGLNPDWLKTTITYIGNYGELIDKNFGKLGIKRGKNNLIKNNGTMNSEAFL